MTPAKLNLPSCSFDLREHDGNTEILDTIRKQWVVLTPEEWVRQHMVRYLTGQLGYSAGLTAIEKGFELNRIPYRADIVIYDRQGKAIRQYNKVIQARYLVVTNGLAHFCVSVDLERGGWEQMERIPEYAPW